MSLSITKERSRIGSICCFEISKLKLFHFGHIGSVHVATSWEIEVVNVL